MNQETSPSSSTEYIGHALIVDDDPISLSMAAHVLNKAGFKVSKVTSGAACLEQIGALCPDFVLMDIQMPDMDGYQTCSLLRQRKDMPDLQIVFVSGNDNLEDRIRAYEAGGDDFISKPISVAELRHKAIKTMAFIAARKMEAEPKEDATGKINELAMQSLLESNVVLSFTRGTLNCKTLEALAQLTINSMRSYGLDSHVQLRSDLGTITQTQRGMASPLEEQIFSHVLNQGRLFQFQKRLVANYDNCSVLTVNMPLDDPEFCGRIRDYVAMIAEAASAAVENIALRLDAIARAETLRTLAQSCRVAIADLREQHQHQQNEIYKELDQTVEGVENMYYHLGLTDKQEDIISTLTRDSRDKVLGLMQQGQSFDTVLAGIVDDLAKNLDTPANIDTESASPGEDELWF